MSRMTCRNGFIFVVATCLGLMVTSARGGSLDSPAAPTAHSESNWSFAVISDPQGGGGKTIGECINTNVDRAMCDAIIKDGVSFVLVSGDLQHGQEGGYDEHTIADQLPVWTNAVSALHRAGIPYYAVRGNHETYNTDGEDPYKAWEHHIGCHMPTNGPEGETGMTYSFPTNNALFIGLDTFNGTKDTTYYYKINQEWLNGKLTNNTRPHLFVFGHEAAFRTGIWCLSDEPADRNKFWDSIANANARTYFCGHEHLYARCLASINNGPALRQIIVGTGGGNHSGWSGYTNESDATIIAEANQTHHWGYLLVRVSGNHVDMAYKSTTNSLTTWATNDVVEWTTNDTFQYTITATPTNFHASNGDYTNKVLISWDAAADASGYEVWRGTHNAPTNSRARIGVTTNTSFSDTNAVPTMHYYYWVRATNTVGTSLFSTSNKGFSCIGPLITANDLVDDACLNIGDPVTIAVQIKNMEPSVGVEVDWWLLSLAGSSWYYLNSAIQWTPWDGNISNCHPFYQGGLFNFPASLLPELRTSGLPVSAYTFWFAIDPSMDGILNVDGPLLVDSVNVSILSVLPAPLVTANGTAREITVNYPENVAITIEMDARAYEGIPADWWVLFCAGSSWYYLDSAVVWEPFDGNPSNCNPLYQGGLFNFPASPVVNMSLPRGTYNLYFAVDYPMNGTMNMEQMWVDSVKVNVQ